MTRVLGGAALRAGMLIGLLLSTAACSTDHAPAVSRERPAARAITTNAQVLDTPFNGIFESQRQLATERDAYERLMSQCTQRAGYDFVPPESYHPLVMLYDFAMPFGPVDVLRAEHFGYHDPVFREGPQAPSWRGKQTPSTVTGIASKAGSATGGCDGSVRQALGGPRPGAALDIASDARDAAVADHRWKEAAGAWRECMQQRGYSFTAPLIALDKFVNRAGPPQPAEIAVASADTRCKASSGYIDTLVGLLRSYEAKAMAEHPAQFEDYAHWKAAALARAEHVVETVAPPPNRYWQTPTGPTTTDPSDLGG